MRANKENKISFAKKVVSGIAISVAVVILFTVITIAGLVIYVHSDADIDKDKLVLENSMPEVYDAAGNLTIYCEASENNVDISEVPDCLKDAFIALEDKRFYDHHGVDYIRVLGALAANIKSGSRAQGGSTITQQIAKNAFLSSEKSFSRKLKEARLAISLERRMSKDEILETYLNMLYFGSGEYGVKNAARRFFGIEVSELTVAQSAMLAGIVKSPTKYNPINNYENALKRSKLVLSLMKEQGKISESEYNTALNEKIVITDDKSALMFDKTYVVNALSEACSVLGIDEKELRVRGYKIYSYLDTERQQALKDIVDDKAYYSDDNALCAAIDADVATGGIRAAYSNFSVDFSSFRRQSGSTLKPIVCYAPAFDSGLLSLASVLEDSPTDFGGYSPKNYGEKYYGKVSVRDALAYSLNIPAVSTLTTIGVQNGYETLKSLGFSLSEDDDNLSLALGSTSRGTTFTELIGGYSALASGGLYKKATFIKYVTDADGNIVYENNEVSPKKVFSEQSAYMTTDALTACAKYGTAKKLSSLPFQIASKTGTVAAKDGNADAYNISYTSDACVLFWQGSERYNNPLSSKITGGGLPTLMCKNYMTKLYSDNIPEDFVRPDSITEVNLDKIALENGKLVIASDKAPSEFVTKDIFDVRYLPAEKDNSFDYPSAKALNAISQDGKISITFTSDPHLSYKVIKKSLFVDDKIILTVEGKDGEVSVSDTPDGLLGYNRYVVVPYYIDDDGRETIGEIYQIPVGW